MRMDKLTTKFQAALADAQSLAVGRDNQFIEPVHLMAALLDQQLAQPPAHEAAVDVEASEAVRGLKGREIFQKPGRFGARSGERRIDRTEDRRESFGLVKLKEPASHFSAGGAHSQQVEELLVLPCRALRGEQLLQGFHIQVLVLHVFLR